jgi:phosphoglycolate phosphatase-like HAD superfamily hydrolase
MANPPWILLDCDGVLLDWDQGIVNHAHKHMPQLSAKLQFNQQHWFLWDRFGISKQESLELIESFHTSEEYEHLAPLPGAQAAIDCLSEQFPMAVITACGVDPRTRCLRTKNLEQAFGNVFAKIICTATSSDKMRYLAEFPPSYWVEDRSENAPMGIPFDHACFLVDAAHNQNFSHTCVIRIKNLLQLVDLIKSNPML